MPQTVTITAVCSCIHPIHPSEEQGQKEAQILQQPEPCTLCAEPLISSFPHAIGHKNSHPNSESCYLWLYIDCSVCGSTPSSSHTCHPIVSCKAVSALAAGWRTQHTREATALQTVIHLLCCLRTTGFWNQWTCHGYVPVCHRACGMQPVQERRHRATCG